MVESIPGPWKIDDRLYEGRVRIVAGPTRDLIALVNPGLDGDIANARLIAQAPAMLECLRAFAEMYPPRPGLTGYFDRARAIVRAVEEG